VRIEAMVTAACSTAIAVSTFMSAVRRQEEARRRIAPGGTDVLDDGCGGQIEYTISDTAEQWSRPVIVCENGLGAPLESWDWIAQELRDEFTIVRYHRRGYGRSTSFMRPADAIMTLLDAVSPDVPISFVTHSMGALVTANSLNESPDLRDLTRTVIMVDGTDAELLGTHRESQHSLGRYRQMSMQEGLASLTGFSRWTASKIENDVNYRATVQKSFLTTSSSPRTLITAYREYMSEPLIGQELIASCRFSKLVVAAGDNVTQQRKFAGRTNSSFSVIDGSNHRSIIGKVTYARALADLIRRMAR
jgi:pimeloyl-ACP methyl ester carboxylesterase